MTEAARQLLKKLAAEGKATKLFAEDLQVAKALEADGLLFLIGQDDPYAVITPKGRRLLVDLETPPKPKPKPPLGFLD
jgi:hypothetical protein